MKKRKKICGGFIGALGALVLLVACVVAPAAAETMAVQPDGKIVVTGRTWPESGALARLNQDGSLDRGFGAEGFVTDHRLPGFRALALTPDGHIVGAAVGGFQLARYLPDGRPDPAFAGGGIGGSPEPDQVRFIYRNYGPSAVLVQPDGGIVVSGTREVNGGGASDGWVKRYDRDGAFAEVVGQVPLPGGPATDSGLVDLAQEPDDSYVGVGWFYAGTPAESEPLIARFVRGSGSPYDPSFGAGQGLLRPPFVPRHRFHTVLNSIAVSGGKVFVAGKTAGTFLVARYNLDGTPDASFGDNGVVAPPISGPGDASSQSGWEPASTWANDVATAAGGAVVLGGGTSQWGTWTSSKNGTYCSECPQPMLARFDSTGHLDPSFGSGGLLRLAKPDGSAFVGEVEQVVALPDGKLLVKGSIPTAGTGPQPWVARLDASGSYDRSFGTDGLTVLVFPCTDQPVDEQRDSGCVGSAGVGLRVKGLRSGRPTVSVKVQANLAWAPIRRLSLALPRRLRLTKGWQSKLRVDAPGVPDAGEFRLQKPSGSHGPILLLQRVPDATELRITLRRGALRLLRPRLSHRPKLSFRMDIAFSDLVAAGRGGTQTIVRRAG